MNTRPSRLTTATRVPSRASTTANSRPGDCAGKFAGLTMFGSVESVSMISRRL
jgi:hypothetical protein